MRKRFTYWKAGFGIIVLILCGGILQGVDSGSDAIARQRVVNEPAGDAVPVIENRVINDRPATSLVLREVRVEEVPVLRAESEHFVLEWVEHDVMEGESEPVAGLTGMTGNPELPKAYSLSQNYPNPFNPSTTIRFDIPESAGERVPVRLDIYNIRGQRIRTLVDRESEPGSYTVQWDGRNNHREHVGSGVYLYRVVAGEFSASRKMVVVK